MPQKTKVRIVVDSFGGVVQEVHHDRPDLDVEVVFLEDAKYADSGDEPLFRVGIDHVIASHHESSPAPKSVSEIMELAEERIRYQDVEGRESE